MGLYRLSARAVSDLEDIADRIAEDNPARAISFVDELIEKFEKIGDHPLAFATRPDLPEHCRVALHGSYRIIYRVGSDAPVVLRVFHSARNTHGIEL